MSASPEAVIRLQGVSKVFPDVPPDTPPALDALTADVPSGQVVGLVGPDAAGKTTLMRLLAGLLLPTSGTVEVLGRAPGSPADTAGILHDVGYMPQRFGLYEDLSVIDNLHLHAELRGLEEPDRSAMFEKLLTFTSLKPFTERLAGKLSGGMKQKLGLACALLTTPRLLLLDEPGVGVDPLSRRELWKMVSDLAVGGMSVLWSTAYMDEAERCAHVLMLEQGRLVYQGPPAGFTGRVAKRVFAFTPPPGEARRMLARWQQEPDIRDALIQGSHIRVVFRDPHDGPFTRSGVDLRPAVPRLEDAYIDAVGGMDRRPSPFLPESERGGGEPGEGRGTLSGERVPFPSPRPSPSFPKTFANGTSGERGGTAGPPLKTVSRWRLEEGLGRGKKRRPQSPFQPFKKSFRRIPRPYPLFAAEKPLKRSERSRLLNMWTRPERSGTRAVEGPGESFPRRGAPCRRRHPTSRLRRSPHTRPRRPRGSGRGAGAASAVRHVTVR